MKRIVLLFCSLSYLASMNLSAQDIEYEDLFVLFLDAKYPKCIEKAEHYTLKDATKKDALPYLYMAMSFFEMSKDQQYSDKFPKAFNDAVKYAKKYRIKDKQGAHFHDFDDFWTEFKFVLIEEAENYYQAGNYRKCGTNYKNITKFNPEDISAWLARAVSEYQNQDASSATASFKKFEELFTSESFNFDDLRKEEKYLLKYGFMWYSQYLLDNGKVTDGQNFIDKGFQYYSEDNEYKNVYNKITGK